MSSFTPLGERIVIKPIEQETETRGGILLPDTAKEKPQEGEVIAVGSGASLTTAPASQWNLPSATRSSTPNTPALNMTTTMMST